MGRLVREVGRIRGLCGTACSSRGLYSLLLWERSQSRRPGMVRSQEGLQRRSMWEWRGGRRLDSTKKLLLWCSKTLIRAIWPSWSLISWRASHRRRLFRSRPHKKTTAVFPFSLALKTYESKTFPKWVLAKACPWLTTALTTSTTSNFNNWTLDNRRLTSSPSHRSITSTLTRNKRKQNSVRKEPRALCGWNRTSSRRQRCWLLSQMIVLRCSRHWIKLSRRKKWGMQVELRWSCLRETRT